LRGGADADALVGDVAHVSSAGEVLLRAEAGNGEDWGQGSGGKGGDNNNVDAFNDALLGGPGEDILAGDVRSNDDAGGIALRVTAGAGGNGGEFQSGGNGGNNNYVTAFTDTLRGDAGAINWPAMFTWTARAAA
jgi:hypothetical protein